MSCPASTTAEVKAVPQHITTSSTPSGYKARG